MGILRSSFLIPNYNKWIFRNPSHKKRIYATTYKVWLHLSHTPSLSTRSGLDVHRYGWTRPAWHSSMLGRPRFPNDGCMSIGGDAGRHGWSRLCLRVTPCWSLSAYHGVVDRWRWMVSFQIVQVLYTGQLKGKMVTFTLLWIWWRVPGRCVSRL